METFLEILKYTVPSLVVFATAYALLNLLLQGYQRQQRAAFSQQNAGTVLPLRLQAYERLAILCDRSALANVLLRVRTPQMNASELKAAIFITLRQEFDHNVSQQVYVSDTLWRIVLLARDQTFELVAKAAEDLPADADGGELVDRIFSLLQQQGSPTPLERALHAVRTEASQLF